MKDVDQISAEVVVVCKEYKAAHSLLDKHAARQVHWGWPGKPSLPLPERLTLLIQGADASVKSLEKQNADMVTDLHQVHALIDQYAKLFRLTKPGTGTAPERLAVLLNATRQR